MVYPSDNKLYSNTPIHQPNKISYMNTLDDTNDQRLESMKHTSEIKQSYQNSVIKEIADEISQRSY
jgi:hypothetical protein